jgi:hypothetical protein
MTMTNENLGKLHDRIRKLLSLSSNNPSAAEAAAAAEKAEALMREHQISMSEIIVDQLQSKNKREHMGRAHAYGNVNKANTEVKEVPDFAQWLAVAVANFFDCHCVMSKMWDGKWNQACVCFLGYKQDIEVCEWTFNYLMQTIRRASGEYRQTLHRRGITGTGQKLHSRSFRQGMAGEITKRLHELRIVRQKKTDTEGGRALVLYQSKLNAIEEVFGKITYRNGTATRIDGDAWMAGIAEGKKVALSTPIAATDPAPQLS